jgi:phosphohistidine swiveling domain-containing protein
MTRPEDYLTKTLEEELINQNYNRQDIDNIFAKISTCPNEIPLSYSEEPLDLLKIALEAKNNVDDLIDKHIEKYAWIKGPLEFEDTCFTKEEYIERLNNLANDNIEEKIENILQVRKNNDIEYISILKQYSFSTKILKLIEAIRNFIFLRTYTTEYSDKLFYTGRHTIFKEITQRTNVVDSDLIMLTDKEILDTINNGKMDSEISELLEDRKKGFAMIWINGAVLTVFGNESIDIQNEIAKVYKTTDDTHIDVEDVIAGDIANKGKASGIARILTSYEDIYKVQKGDIIVATMTTPDYIFAMEKAAAFITDEGGITCHAAILSREFNVPCIVGTIDATDKIKDGDLIEVDAYNGKIYKIK